VHAEFSLTQKLENLFGEIKAVLSWFDLLYLNEAYEKWIVYFLALAQPVSQLNELRFRLGLPKKVVEIMTFCRGDGERLLNMLHKKPQMAKSDIHKLLAPIPTEALLFIMAKAGPETGRKAISLYFMQLKSIKISVKGEDLKTLGLQPGPLYKRILGELLDERLNGNLLTREDEIDYVRQHFLPQEEKGAKQGENHPHPSLPLKGGGADSGLKVQI
ncbi:MAG TPA: hypothetical protein VK564_08145, partial [Thermodesulfobacteriota bacterium]|nr:hypothetical protein [Thermodesulfobacteriota bacterium]